MNFAAIFMSKAQRLISEVESIRKRLGLENVASSNPATLVKLEKEIRSTRDSIHREMQSREGDELDKLAIEHERLEMDLADIEKALKEKTGSSNLGAIEREILSFGKALQQIREQEQGTLKHLKKEMPDIYAALMKRLAKLDSLLEETSIIDLDEEKQEKKAKLKVKMIVLLGKIRFELG